MRVLIADEFPKQHLESLKGMGVTVDYRPELKADQLPEAAKDASILVVRSTEVQAPVFEKAHALSLVIRAGAGVNTIDVKAASARGVFVANTPGQNNIAVAELTLGLILALDRRIPDNVASLREGKWNKKEYSKARGLYGRTLGLVGMGAIAQAVAERALAFGLKVRAYSPRSLTEARAQHLGVQRAESVMALASQSDILSVHVPASAETKGLISRQVLAAMPTGGIFINTSRADVVDQAALLEEARGGRLWVGADVFQDEPKGGEATFQHELAKLPNVYGTHHIGASTDQAQSAVASETMRIIDAYLNRGEVPNCVNVAQRTPAKFQIIVRHYDRVGVLANVLDAIRQAGINAQEMENTIFEGAVTACAKIQLEAPLPQDALERIRSRDEVIFADMVQLRQ
ncbi:MAG TPA: 3-phosphoglycerate dehydrogenase family protein [Myxococcaceae bacterium]|nr:3-phosphoglycerate dehydrogenase family protein [Myxococcaceae bacterium]